MPWNRHVQWPCQLADVEARFRRAMIRVRAELGLERLHLAFEDTGLHRTAPGQVIGHHAIRCSKLVPINELGRFGHLVEDNLELIGKPAHDG